MSGKKRKKYEVSCLQQIINEWDPIGLFPIAPKDEYVEEIRKIEEYIESMPNFMEEQLADKINEIFVTLFGNDVYKENVGTCIFVAKKIIEILF